MKAPSISVSMADAANTRENEGPCICDSCRFTDFCSHDAVNFCEENEREAAEEYAAEARRDDRL